MADQISSDPRDDVIQTYYPYPLAATFHRAFYGAPYLDEIHEYLLDLFEVTLKYLTTIALAQYLKDGATSAKINRDLLNLQRPSLGHWQGWLRDILDLYRREKRPLVVPELATFYSKKNTAELATAYAALRQIMTERMGATRSANRDSGVTPQQFFVLLGEYRNKLAHSARPSRYDKKEIATILMPAMRALLLDLDFLAEYRLVYINEVQVDFVDGDPNKYGFAHRVTYLVGDRPRVSQKLQVLENAPARAKELYLLDKNAEFLPMLSLHPFLVFRHCESCNAEQAFLLNQSREKTLDYISYQCTHHFSPTEYIDYMQSLLNDMRVDGDDDGDGNGAATDNIVVTLLSNAAIPEQATAMSAPEWVGTVATVDAVPVPVAAPTYDLPVEATTTLHTNSNIARAPGPAATVPLPTAMPDAERQVAPFPVPIAISQKRSVSPALLGLAAVGVLLLLLALFFVVPLLEGSPTATPGSGIGSTLLPTNTAVTARVGAAITAANAGQVTAVETLLGHNQGVDGLTISPDGQTLASASSGENAIRLWRLADNSAIGTIDAPTAFGVRFMPDGSLLSLSLQSVDLWSVLGGAKLRTLGTVLIPAFTIATAPDGKTAATDVKGRGSISLWNTSDGGVLRTLSGHEDNVYSIAFSPDGKLLASGGSDKVVRIWNLADGTMLRLFEGHSNDIKSIVWSLDGETLASGSEDGTVRLWRVAGDKPAQVLSGHSDAVMSLAFSPDGTIIASGSRDSTVRLWRSSDGTALATLQGHSAYVDALTFTPDGATLASGSGDKTVRLWGIPR